MTEWWYLSARSAVAHLVDNAPATRCGRNIQPDGWRAPTGVRATCTQCIRTEVDE